jgi:hypothetical protein
MPILAKGGSILHAESHLSRIDYLAVTITASEWDLPLLPPSPERLAGNPDKACHFGRREVGHALNFQWYKVMF